MDIRAIIDSEIDRGTEEDQVWEWNNTTKRAEATLAPVALDARYKLTHVGVITAQYNANVQEHIQADVSGGGFHVLLPEAPEDGVVIVVQNATIAPTTNVLEIRTSGSDTIAIESGPTSLYTTLLLETVEFNYHLGDNVWEITHTAPPSNFATGFPGISTQTPLSASDYDIGVTTPFTFVISPPLGYLDVFVDGNGKVAKFRKDGDITFPVWTNTSGIWFFYFDTTGTPVTTQTPWETDDFSEIATVNRFFWNSVTQEIQSLGFEAHPNDIPADTHAWFHLQGTIWSNGLEIATNAITSGNPDPDGSNTVVALSSGTIIDDNLRHDVENSTGGGLWQQDLGDTTPATLDNTNSGVFPILYLTGDAGIVGTHAATRFPFPYSGLDAPLYYDTLGNLTSVANNQYFSVFIWAIGDSRTGRFASVTTSPLTWTSVGLGALAAAEAYNWESITADIALLADEEIRPLYRLIYQHVANYSSGARESALRLVTDLRRAEVTSIATAAGSVPATSVTVAPVGNLSSTNAQSAFQELDAEITLNTAHKDGDGSDHSDVALNTDKVTNATHTGDANGDGELTLQPAAITGKPGTTVASGDLILVADVGSSNALKQVTAQSIGDLGGGGAITGLDTEVLFFDGDNNPAGDSGLTYIKGTGALTAGGLINEAEFRGLGNNNYRIGDENTMANMTDRGEVQTCKPDGLATGGTYTITYDGETTDPIGFSASRSTIQAELEALINVAPGDIEVTGHDFIDTTFFSFGLQLAFLASLGNVNPVSFDASSLTGVTTVTVTQGNVGGENLAFGPTALRNLLTGVNNVCVGNAAGQNLESGNHNFLFGAGAGSTMIDARFNVFMGTSVGAACQGESNVGIGFTTMQNLVGVRASSTGLENVGIGSQVMRGGVGSAFRFNVAIGARAGFDLTDSNARENVLIGWESGTNLQSSARSVMIGSRTGHEDTSLSNCLFLGDSAGYWETANSTMLISTIDRTAQSNEAGGRSKALMWGNFSTTTANQKLQVNAQFTVTDEIVMLPNLPTLDPSNVGQLWNDSGTIKVSI